MASLFELEVKYWQVDRGLDRFDQLKFPEQQWKVMKLLKEEPGIDISKS